MVTRAVLLAEARSWMGTPFHHQGRMRGVGCDCAGLIIGVAQSLDLTEFDITGYGRHPHSGQLYDLCREHMHAIALDELAPGDVALLRFERDPQHLAFVGDYASGGLSLIHSYIQAGGVVEHRLDVAWAKRILAAFRIPGVD